MLLWSVHLSTLGYDVLGSNITSSLLSQPPSQPCLLQFTFHSAKPHIHLQFIAYAPGLWVLYIFVCSPRRHLISSSSALPRTMSRALALRSTEECASQFQPIFKSAKLSMKVVNNAPHFSNLLIPRFHKFIGLFSWTPC